MAATTLRDFAVDKHAAYFREHMRVLPHHYKGMDTNRLTLLYFCVSGLDLLGMLEDLPKHDIVEYIYSYMSPLRGHGGFYGYPRLAMEDEEQDRCNNQPHIANTYVALVMLLILGDDLRRVDREAVAGSLRKWQLPDGSFCCVHGVSSLDSESDIRFVYCAACICYILDLWHAVDVPRMRAFLLASRSYDQAFGMGPATESHGGCTYCALAALSMMGQLHDLSRKEELIDWCVKRQHFGFQGRIEKPMDSCYSFWVGASLSLLGVGCFLDAGTCLAFLRECEFAAGGFQKFPEVKAPDLLHSYFSVCGLALCGLLGPLNPRLGMSERAFRAAVGGHFAIAPGGSEWTPPLVQELRPSHPAQSAVPRPRRGRSPLGGLLWAALAALVLALAAPLWAPRWLL